MTTGFADRYGPWAVIAGASEGIGAVAARQLGERGVNVVLVSRPEPQLQAAADAVATATRTVELDLSRPGAAAELADATADLDVGLLMYIAGGVPPARFLDAPVAEWRDFVVRNCVNVVETVHHFGGKMAPRGRGGIIVMGSLAGWVGSALFAVYGATKAFDLVFAEGLWAELRPHGVDVLIPILGATDTPTMNRVLDGRPPPVALADAEDVVRDMLDNLGNGPTFPAGPARGGEVPRRELVELMSTAVLTTWGDDS